jgi:hypothetical protein
MSIVINNTRAVNEEIQLCFLTITYDGTDYKYNANTPVLEGSALQAHCDSKESRWTYSIVYQEYPGARFKQLEGNSDFDKLLAWVDAGATNTAYCSIAEHATEETCVANGGTWTPEEVITKVPFTNSHDYAGDMRVRKLESVRADAKTQIEDVAGYPQWFQNNCANGLYPSATGDAMTAYIALVITESNRCEDLVEVAATIDDALAVEANWPSV